MIAVPVSSISPKVLAVTTLLLSGMPPPAQSAQTGPDSFSAQTFAPQAQSPLAEVYAIGGNCPPGLLTGKFAVSVDEIREGAATVEKFFGFEPGSHVKTLLFAMLPFRGNALAQYCHPDAFRFHPMILSMESGLNLQAFHEGVHLFDDRYEYRLSAGKFKDLHEEIKQTAPWFFERLDEDKFIPGVRMLGHSKDDEHEFLASLINSFNHPGWETAMRAESAEFREIYLRTLEALCENLGKIDEIQESSPLVRVVEEHIEALR